MTGLPVRTGGSEPSPLASRILAIVEDIPAGRVLTYGDVAEAVGTRAARVVGMVMARYGDEVSWWRVVRASGEPTRSAPEQALRLLADEGAPLRGDRVDLALGRWDGC